LGNNYISAEGKERAQGEGRIGRAREAADMGTVMRQRASNTVDQDVKLRELILLFAELSEGDLSFGATKLNKQLFFADATAYLTTGKTITGQEYQRLPQGPAPRRMPPVVETMKEQGELAERPTRYHGFAQRRFFALREADPDVFTPEELDIAFRVLNQYRNWNASDMSRASHECLAWQLLDDGETIPFQMLLIGDRDVTPRERRRGEDLEGVARECLSRYAQ
jgi:hypothetical protein